MGNEQNYRMRIVGAEVCQRWCIVVIVAHQLCADKLVAGPLPPHATTALHPWTQVLKQGIKETLRLEAEAAAAAAAADAAAAAERAKADAEHAKMMAEAEVSCCSVQWSWHKLRLTHRCTNRWWDGGSAYH